MGLFWLIIFVILLCFAFVIFFGAPYLPTLKPQITAALDLLDLKPGQTMLEIGSGDGRVLKAAAERGWCGVGYELNPLLVLVSLWNTRKYRSRIRIIWGNAWTEEWPEVEGIYAFILKKFMPKLHTKIVQSIKNPTKVVSFSFQIPDKKLAAESQGVYLYKYMPKR